MPSSIFHKRIKWIFLLIVLAGMTLSFFIPSHEQAAPAPAQGKADHSDQCSACHESLVTQFKGTAHGKAGQFVDWAFDKGCESCHGDATEHINAGGDKSKIVNPARLKAEEVNKNCMACHQSQRAQMHWKGSSHESANLKCADCHKVHNSPAEKAMLAKKTETETCLACHGNVRRAMYQRSAHPLREGKMSCTSCHNPHGTMVNNKLLAANSTNDLCLKCHTEKRGPFLWEHAPVRENCMTCHTPHGSNHDKLIKVKVTMTCQSCHDQGRHQSVAGRPNALWNIGRACLQCHQQIHGSNHPAGQLFQR